MQQVYEAILTNSGVPREDAALSLILEDAARLIVGKRHESRLALACVLARGHLLIEDMPGVGKTTLAHVLARLLGLDFQRIQFTADMLPADLLGVSIFDPEQQSFRFHPGPVFCQVLLADEINRASPKTQSALLEAMAEGQISQDGQTRALPQPFFVIATQNPQEQSGTFPLPESQLDRFMMRLSLGYPGPEAELRLLKGDHRADSLDTLPALFDAEELARLRGEVQAVSCSDAVLGYLLDLVGFSRRREEDCAPLSPRASRALLAAAKAWAYISGRQYLVPDDIQAVFPAVAEHRLRAGRMTDGSMLSQHLLAQVNPIR